MKRKIEEGDNANELQTRSKNQKTAETTKIEAKAEKKKVNDTKKLLKSLAGDLRKGIKKEIINKEKYGVKATASIGMSVEQFNELKKEIEVPASSFKENLDLDKMNAWLGLEK